MTILINLLDDCRDLDPPLLVAVCLLIGSAEEVGGAKDAGGSAEKAEPAEPPIDAGGWYAPILPLPLTPLVVQLSTELCREKDRLSED